MIPALSYTPNCSLVYVFTSESTVFMYSINNHNFICKANQQLK